MSKWRLWRYIFTVGNNGCLLSPSLLGTLYIVSQQLHSLNEAPFLI